MIRSQISERKQVRFEIFDTPGLFDTTLANNLIEKTMEKFFLYDCSQVNLVFIMIKQDRIASEFQDLIKNSLAMFQKSAAPILRLVITHSDMKSRAGYMVSFFQTKFIRDLITEWKFEQRNFVFVDLSLRDQSYQPNGNHDANEDVAAMCLSLMDSTVPLHKTEVFSQFLDKDFQQVHKSVSNPFGAIAGWLGSGRSEKKV